MNDLLKYISLQHHEHLNQFYHHMYINLKNIASFLSSLNYYSKDSEVMIIIYLIMIAMTAGYLQFL